jgi:hypothetical protein
VGDCAGEEGEVGEVGLAWVAGSKWVGDCGWDRGLESSESWFVAR